MFFQHQQALVLCLFQTRPLMLLWKPLLCVLQQHWCLAEVLLILSKLLNVKDALINRVHPANHPTRCPPSDALRLGEASNSSAVNSEYCLPSCFRYYSFIICHIIIKLLLFSRKHFLYKLCVHEGQEYIAQGNGNTKNNPNPLMDRVSHRPG